MLDQGLRQHLWRKGVAAPLSDRRAISPGRATGNPVPRDKKLEASIADGSWKEGVGLDANRPWNHCFSLLLTPEVKVWWQENFKDHTILIITGARSLSQYLSGDARISTSASIHHPSSGSDGAIDGNSGKRAKINDQPEPSKKKAIPKNMQACKGMYDCVPARVNACLHTCVHT